MREQLIHHVELLFDGAANAEDIKQEILQNTLDRYDDLIAQGKSPDAAYNLSVSGIGDLSEILGPSETPSDNCKAADPKPYSRHRKVTAVIMIAAIVLLLGILLAGLAFHALKYNAALDNKNYLSGPSSVDASLISNLDIQWAAGSIQIIAGNTESITFTESGGGITPLAYAVEEGTLTIRYREPKFPSIFVDEPKKDLTITVPKFWTCSYSVESASATLYAYDLRAYSFDLECASGECKFDGCYIENMRIDTASGSILYEGQLDSLDCNAVSADFVGIFSETPDWIRMDSVSGDLDITLPSDSGFRATTNGISTKVISEFDTSYNNGVYQHSGDDNCNINFSGVSGMILIQKGS